MFRFDTPFRPHHPPLADRRWWWLLACLIIALLSPTRTLANSDPSVNLIVRQAFWEDASGQADWQLAQGQIYTPYRGLFSRGFTSSAHWIRLTLAPNTTRTALVIKPTWLDSVTLYDPEGSPIPITLGDHHHSDDANGWSVLGYAFELPPSTRQRDVWLRLQTTSSHVLMVSAMPMDQALKASAREILWVALYTSVQVLILCLLTFMWWSMRDRLLGLYLVRHAVFAAYGTSYLGLPTVVLGDVPTPSFMHYLFVVLAVCVVPAGLRFDVAFLSLYRPHPFWIRLVKVVAGSSAIAMLLVLLGETQLALQLNVWIVIAALPVILMTVLSTQPVQPTGAVPSRRVMLAYYVVVVSSLPIGLVNLLGQGGFQAWGLYGLIVHGLLTGLLMSFMLLVRSQRLAKHHQRVSWELRKSQQDMALEQRRREEQSQFLHMLMHELKTPLSIVSMAIGTRSNREANLEHAGRAVQDMKAIIERCVQADQIGELTLHQRHESVDLPGLIAQSVQDLAHLASRVQLSAPAEVPGLQTDRQLLKIVLTNLLSNAQRYSDEHTPIGVHVTPEDRALQPGLCVRVVNTPGLAGWPDELLVFSKYYRASGAQRQTGSGLGLYLSQQLARSLGGTLEYAPSEHHVEFILWIPLAPV